MQSNNFQPLKNIWPHLHEHASLAERYVYSDPHTATIKLRCFAELVVETLYIQLNLPSEPKDGFFEKLTAPLFLDLVEEAVIQKLHAIRIQGNKAAHGKPIPKETALALIKEAFLIGQWFYKTCEGTGSDEYPSYVSPLDYAIRPEEPSQGQEQLAEQLAAAKEELLRLAEYEKNAQTEIAALNQLLDHEKLNAFKNSARLAASSIDFEADVTANLISINDVFEEYTLNDGQAELVNRLGDFLDNRTESVFLLKGYAGTGKTFITKGLTEYLRAIARNYILSAPTGKASKVIANKTKSLAYTIHKTIYSFKDIVEYRDDGVEGTETFKFYAQLAVNGCSVDTVYIVDEASMIADIYQESEFFRCGSGHLLTDFLKFVNLDHNDHSKKVIFIGDDAQLPPIGMNFSPALSSDYLFREHHVRATSFELTEVVRQKSDSGVIANAIPLRKSLQSGVFNQLSIDFSYPDIMKAEYPDLMRSYLESCGHRINGESIIIAHSNSDVADYNRMIRAHFFPDRDEVVAGDKVMAVVNSDSSGIFISNGDFGLIRRVLSNPETRLITLKRKNPDSNELEHISVPLVFRDVEVGFKDLDGTPHFFQAKILEQLLYSNDPGLSSDQNKALYVDFCIRNEYLKPVSVEFKHTLKSDPYFNALRLKFGYAITCHKAQGSEWNHVFVKCKSHQSQLTSDYFRWLYTAITRTAKNLYLLDPPSLKLGGKIKEVPNPGIGPKNQPTIVHARPDHVPRDTVSSSVVNGDSSDTLENFEIPATAPFLLAILKEVRVLLEGTGMKIDCIIHNQYQEAYFIARDDDLARINIGYSNRQKITSLSAPQLSDFSSEAANILSPLRGSLVFTSIHPETKEFCFSKSFLLEFHQKILSLSAASSIAIKNVVEQQWALRYTFTKGAQIAVFDVWYNGRSQFTKCQAVMPDCSPGLLVNEVGALLTNGMGA